MMEPSSNNYTAVNDALFVEIEHTLELFEFSTSEMRDHMVNNTIPSADEFAFNAFVHRIISCVHNEFELQYNNGSGVLLTLSFNKSDEDFIMNRYTGDWAVYFTENPPVLSNDNASITRIIAPHEAFVPRKGEGAFFVTLATSNPITQEGWSKSTQTATRRGVLKPDDGHPYPFLEHHGFCDETSAAPPLSMEWGVARCPTTSICAR